MSFQGCNHRSFGFGGGLDPEKHVTTRSKIEASLHVGQVWTSTSSSSLEGFVMGFRARGLQGDDFLGKLPRNQKGESTSKVPRFTEVRLILFVILLA